MLFIKECCLCVCTCVHVHVCTHTCLCWRPEMGGVRRAPRVRQGLLFRVQAEPASGSPLDNLNRLKAQESLMGSSVQWGGSRTLAAIQPRYSRATCQCESTLRFMWFLFFHRGLIASSFTETHYLQDGTDISLIRNYTVSPAWTAMILCNQIYA